jgi:hypothetical protein
MTVGTYFLTRIRQDTHGAIREMNWLIHYLRKTEPEALSITHVQLTKKRLVALIKTLKEFERSGST